MPKEESLEGLFEQFDEIVDSKEPPAIPADSRLTRSRVPSLTARGLRWVLQGGGLLATLLLLVLVNIVEPREWLGNLLGLSAVVFIASPLLGQGPLAQPLRWFNVTFLALALSIVPATFSRWPGMLAESNAAPVSVYIASACSVLEQATSPTTLLLTLALAVGLFFLSQALSHANPWIESRARRSPWRRVLSLALLGTILGGLLALPLGHQALWGQSWIVELAKGPWISPPSVPYSRPGDLGGLILGRDASSEEDLDTKLVLELSDPDLDTATQKAAQYLQQAPALTIADRLIIIRLMRRCLEAPRGASVSEFLWQAYLLVHHDRLTPSMNTLATEALRRQVLPALCQSETTPELLTLWQQRSEELLVLKPSQAFWHDHPLDSIRACRRGGTKPGSSDLQSSSTGC